MQFIFITIYRYICNLQYNNVAHTFVNPYNKPLKEIKATLMILLNKNLLYR